MVISKNREIRQEIADDNYRLMLMENEELSWNIPASRLGFLLLQKHGLILFPVEDSYWSGCIFVKDGKRIPVINTAQPRVNQYFTAWHEVYHLFFDRVSFDHPIDSEITLAERKAENFAASNLLSGVSQYFSSLPEMDFVSKIFLSMSTFQAPYKAVLIALYEFALEEENDSLCTLIKTHFDDHFDDLPDRFRMMGLDDDLVLPSYTINVNYLKDKIRERASERPDLRYNKTNQESLDNTLEQVHSLLRK